jgi:hypothetical protein
VRSDERILSLECVYEFLKRFGQTFLSDEKVIQIESYNYWPYNVCTTLAIERLFTYKLPEDGQRTMCHKRKACPSMN